MLLSPAEYEKQTVTLAYRCVQNSAKQERHALVMRASYLLWYLVAQENQTLAFLVTRTQPEAPDSGGLSCTPAPEPNKYDIESLALASLWNAGIQEDQSMDFS